MMLARLVTVITLAVAVGTFVASALLVGMAGPRVPMCQEDEVVVGSGDFHRDGFWDAYHCESRSEVGR